MSADIFQTVTESSDPHIRRAVGECEQRWGLKFASVVYFPQSCLRPRASAIRAAELSPRLKVVSRKEKEITEEMALLSEIANSQGQSPEMETQTRYLGSLHRICDRFSSEAARSAQDLGSFCVGLNRGGFLLTQSLGWVEGNQLVKLDAKRIPFQGGLLIGLGDLDGEASPTSRQQSAFSLEGAIASGATLIALMNLLKQRGIEACKFYAVHAAWEGIASIAHAAETLEVELELTVGHADHGLNSKFYSVRQQDGRELLNLGDVGDNISLALKD